MAGNLNNPALHRNYGATSSMSTSAITSMPDANFSGLSSTEFKSLSDCIGNNIIAVTSSWRQLDKAVKVIGTPRDTPAYRDKVHYWQSQTNTLIQTTIKDLQRLTAIMRYADKQQKLRQEELINEFQQVVEKYSDTQQKIAATMKQVVLLSLNIPQEDEESTGITDEREILINRQQNTEESLQFKKKILLDQEIRNKQIEANVLDVKPIFLLLSNLVEEQGQQVDSMERNNMVADVAVIDGGAADIRKATESWRSFRDKILIQLAIALIIILIVIGIIVIK